MNGSIPRLHDVAAGLGDVTSSKGWLPLDWPSLLRASVTALTLAVVDSRLLDGDTKVRDPSNLLLIPVVLASEKAQDKVFRNYNVMVPQAAFVAVGAFLVNSLVAGASWKHALHYSIAAGALFTVADVVSSSNTYMKTI